VYVLEDDFCNSSIIACKAMRRGLLLWGITVGAGGYKTGKGHGTQVVFIGQFETGNIGTAQEVRLRYFSHPVNWPHSVDDI